MALYWLVLAVCAIAAFLVDAYFRSVAGALAMPVRDNEIRVEFLGMSVSRLIHTKLVISGLLAGMGGALAALAVGHVDPNMSYWTTSGEFVFITILSGAGSVVPAFVGSLVFESVRSFAFAMLPQLWQMLLGSVLLLTILFLPQGLGSLITRLRWRRKVGGAMSAPILSVRDLGKRFGAMIAARDITVSVPAQQTVGVIGSNGAGKTTFINMITGHLRPTTGNDSFRGARHHRPAFPQRSRQWESRDRFRWRKYSPRSRYSRTCALRLRSAARPKNFMGHVCTPLRSRESVAEAETLLDLFEIARYRDTLAATLPQGVRKLLDIGMAVAGSPRLLLLDEPTSGISIEEKFDLMQVVMSALRNRRITVLFVEHDMEIVERFAERVLAFYDGTVIADGTPAATLADARVQALISGPKAKGAAAASPMFRVSNLNVSIGPVPIIRGASFALEEGEMCGLIGRNGSGKTTLFRAIMGAIPASGMAELGHGRLVEIAAASARRAWHRLHAGRSPAGA